MEWLKPWLSTEGENEKFREVFAHQPGLEVGPEHQLFRLSTRLIGRGQGDDALFEILDGTGRVAVVHLTWAKTTERHPWPITKFYADIQEWVEKCMRPEHEAWDD